MTGNMATLTGFVTNTTGFDVNLSADAPFVTTNDVDGSKVDLYGDFQSPPREFPGIVSVTLKPDQRLSYRSIPTKLINAQRRWTQGSGWKPIAQFEDFETTEFCQQRSVPTFHDID